MRPEAEQDLEGIETCPYAQTGDWVYVDGVIDEIMASMRAVCVFPLRRPVCRFIGPDAPKHEYRSYNVGHYKVFYRVEEKRRVVVIYRIHV